MSTNVQKQNRKSKPDLPGSDGGGGQSGGFGTKSKTCQKGTNQGVLINLDWLSFRIERGYIYNPANYSFQEWPGGSFLTWLKNPLDDTSNQIGIVKTDTKEFKLELLPGGGGKYLSKANIYFDNEHFAIILFDTNYPNLKGTAQIEITNPFLYKDCDLQAILNDFLQGINSKVLNVFRVDVAMDGHSFRTFADQIYKHEIVPTRLGLVNGGRWSPNYDTLKAENSTIEGGSRSSGRNWRLYDKDREIAEKSKHKVYILDHFQANGLRESKGNIWRLEFELKNDFLKTIDGFMWDDVFDKNKLLALAQVATHNYFEWVDSSVIKGIRNAEQRKKRLQRAERIQVIDFTRVKTDSYQRIKSKPKPKSDRTEKMICKYLAQHAALTSENEPEKALHYALAAGLVMEGNDLQNYITRKTHFWQPQIEREAWRRGIPVNSMVDLGNLAASLTDLQNCYV